MIAEELVHLMTTNNRIYILQIRYIHTLIRPHKLRLSEIWVQYQDNGTEKILKVFHEQDKGINMTKHVKVYIHGIYLIYANIYLDIYKY